MSNYNKVLLMGRLTRDPEVRYTPQGVAVTEIGVAVNREYTVGTERRKDTTFVDVTLWRRQAEVVCQYLKKGDPIFIEGYLSLDTWEGQDGQKRQKMRVVADNFQFIGGRTDGEGRRGGGDDTSQIEGGGAPRRSSFQPRSGGGPGRDPAGSRGPAASSGASRIPQEAFSPIPEDEPPGPGGGKGETGLEGVDESEIPF